MDRPSAEEDPTVSWTAPERFMSTHNEWQRRRRRRRRRCRIASSCGSGSGSVCGTLWLDHNRSMPELHRFNYNKRVSKLPDANICTLCSRQSK